MATTSKPLQAEQQQAATPAGPCTIVIFGASGDLTKRKLIPALYHLARTKYLPKNFAIVGFAFDQFDTESYRKKVTEDIRQFAEEPVDEELWNWFLERIYYMQGDFGQPAEYERLKAFLAETSQKHQTGDNCLFYLATSPKFFSSVIQQLGKAGMLAEENDHWRRVIIEKPFGHDLASSVALNVEIRKCLSERQIYRIDHYLGKETVQNLMIFRFANGIFEPIWNRRYIDHVQITVAETVGVEQRGGYYDTAGALRDMVPNHILQLISLTAMEPPNSFVGDAVRDEKAKVLHAIQPLKPEECAHCVVRGQYTNGVMDRLAVPGYRAEPNVEPDSNTETFTAIKMYIDNWRWAGVPFYVRTGKRLATRVSEMTIQFKQAPFMLFRDTPVEHLKPNLLVVQIQPEEGIWLRFGAKIPGPHVDIGAVQMNFKYVDYFGSSPSTGYETLLHDCMIGDSTLFQRADMVEAGWAVVDPILKAWSGQGHHALAEYPAGAWGPTEADEMIERDGRHWRSTT